MYILRKGYYIENKLLFFLKKKTHTKEFGWYNGLWSNGHT